MSSSLYFDLEQGSAKGIRLGFLDAHESDLVDLASVHRVKQVHGCRIVDAQSGSDSTEADGLVSNIEELERPLLVSSADCCPLLMVDAQRLQVVAIHAGWRGLQQGIHRRPFEAGLMDPSTTWIWCGPCLHGLDFEVADDMWSQFPQKVFENELFFRKSAGLTSKKRHFFVWDYLQNEFDSLGVELFYNVQISTRSDRAFHSYRRWKAEAPARPLGLNRSWVGRRAPQNKSFQPI
jgi:copper oxidase (laccase) domain-containing protein